MNEDTVNYAPPVPVKGPNGEDLFLRQAYAVMSPQESLNIAKAVVGLIASGLAMVVGYQLTPIKPEATSSEP